MDVRHLINQKSDSCSELLSWQIAIQYADLQFYRQLNNQEYAGHQHFDQLKYHSI